MESSRDDNLAAALKALRPAPRPAFAAELDERAAAGFPRRGRQSRSPLARVSAHLHAMSPRRALLPACGGALAALVVTTAVIVTNDSRSIFRNAAPQVIAVGGKVAAGKETAEVVRPSGNVKLPSSANASGTAKLHPFADPTPRNFDDSGPSLASGGHLTGLKTRDVQRSAQLVLGADPTEISADAAKVFAAVHVYHGIVLNSSVHDGSGEFAPGASFELLIPSAKLGDALGALSQIADVRYRREGTRDITASTVSAGERLQDANAKVESLLAQLASAETEGEREAVEAQLETERRHAAFLRSQLQTLRRRASLSLVSLKIKSGDAAGPSSSTGNWSIGDALHDAGQVLAIAAGVAIVGLAVLGPLALIALLVWLANRAWIRRGRRGALG